MGIKRARAVIREEFQSGGGVGGGLPVLHCKKIAIKKLHLVLLAFFNTISAKLIKRYTKKACKALI